MMGADRKLISQDKQSRAAYSAIIRRADAKRAARARQPVYRGGAKLSNPVIRERDPAYAKQFKQRSNPNKIKRA